MSNRKMMLIFSAVLIFTVGGSFLSLHFSGSRVPLSSSAHKSSSTFSSGKPRKNSVPTNAVTSNNSTSSGDETYWLHKSSLKLPDKNVCLKAQKQALDGLSDAQAKGVQKEVREAHIEIEFFLVDHVKALKSPQSPYWAYIERKGTISIPGDALVWNDWDKDTVIDDLKEISSPIKNEVVKSDFKRMQNTLKTAVEQHNLHKVFSYHEMIHDYDYWVINYPVYLQSPPADWGGIQTYFGTPSLIVNH